MNVKFRKALVDDWQTIIPLLEQMGSVQSEERSRERFKGILEDDLHFIIVAEISDTLVGYA
jgi:hypothetical protein